MVDMAALFWQVLRDQAPFSSTGSLAHNPTWQTLHSKQSGGGEYEEESGQETLGRASKVCHTELLPAFNHMATHSYKQG